VTFLYDYLQGQHAKNNKWNKKQTSSIPISFLLLFFFLCQMFAKSTQVGSIYFKIQLSLLKPFSTEKWFAYREENNQKMIENKVELFWVKNSTEYI
jgi:hypothetical protein